MPEHFTSDTLAAAYSAHAPTLHERKAAAALWVPAAMIADNDGKLSDVFSISDVDARLRETAKAYATVDACAGTATENTSGALSVASALSSCEEFGCDTGCWPDLSVLGSAAGPAMSLLKKIGLKLAAPKVPTGEEPPLDWKSLYQKLHSSTLSLTFSPKDSVSSMSKRVGDALDKGLSEEDVKAIEKIVSTVVSTTEDVAKAAQKAGVANAALIAETCSALGAGLLAQQIADGLEPARQLVADCWAFKSSYCGAMPPCTNPDPCAKQGGNACLASLVRVPNGPSDLPSQAVGCVDPTNPGSCSHPSRDGGPIDADSSAPDSSAADSSTGTSGTGGTGAGDGLTDAGPDAATTQCCCKFDAEHYCDTRYDPCWNCVQSATPIDGYLCGSTCNAPEADQCVTTCP